MERLLVELGGLIEWPEHADQAPAVLRRLSAPARPARRRRWVPVTAVLVLVLASILLLSPRAREAVADLLGVAGIEVRFAPDAQPPIGFGLDLGEAVTLAEASEAVDFDLVRPGALGPPDAVYLSRRPSEGRISMVWEGAGTLPGAGESSIGLIYSQFALDLAENELFVKSVRPDNGVRAVDVGGIIGLWIDGAPHQITYEDAAANIVEEETRLAGNVLMWERAGVTHRIETILPLQQALQIAESVRSLDWGPGSTPVGLNSGAIGATI
jgi:hypothetical protein